MNDWHNLCITDKSGQEFFKCTASPMSTASEIKNLKRKLEEAKRRPSLYSFLDVDTATVMLDGKPYGEAVSNLDADALLKELGL